jgi:predicted membrane chloride channel (bestrophin family)
MSLKNNFSRRLFGSLSSSPTSSPSVLVGLRREASSRLSVPQPAADAAVLRARAFWQFRTARFQETNSERGNPWSLREIFAAASARKVPLKVTGALGLYNCLVAAPMIAEHAGVAPAWVLEMTGWLVQDSTRLACGALTSLLAGGMFLMLSFRLNRAVSRWWEAHTLVTALHSDCATLLTSIQMYVPEIRAQTEFGILTYAIARATEYQLTNVPEQHWRRYFAALFPSPAQAASCSATPVASDHEAISSELTLKLCARPVRERQAWLLHRLGIELGTCFDAGGVPAGIRALVQMKQRLENMQERVAGLQRIQSTPESWSYQKHLRLTTLLWVHLLPFSVLPSLGAFSIPVCTVVGFIVIKLDDISVELQSPFGADSSDVDLSSATSRLQEAMHAHVISSIDLHVQRAETPPVSK